MVDKILCTICEAPFSFIAQFVPNCYVKVIELDNNVPTNIQCELNWITMNVPTNRLCNV